MNEYTGISDLYPSSPFHTVMVHRLDDARCKQGIQSFNAFRMIQRPAHLLAVDPRGIAFDSRWRHWRSEFEITFPPVLQLCTFDQDVIIKVRKLGYHGVFLRASLFKLPDPEY
jgi:hypothetical protein